MNGVLAKRLMGGGYRITFECGGLGIDDLKNRNLALLAKWGWQLLVEEESLWCKVVESIYGSNSHNWHTSGKIDRSL